MPKDNIERAIRRGSGGGEGDSYEEIRYEGYGPGGVAVMVDAMTDNRNRSAADVRHAFSKHGGNLGADGSVAYLFNRVGVLSYPSGSDEERVLGLALTTEAEDVITNDDGSIDVLTAPEDYESVKAAMEEAGHAPEQGEVTMRAFTNVTLEEDDAENMLKLLEALEDLDDVQQVYSNADISEEILMRLVS
jgi:YebC/PmpR family DNA-binding regulatory protein